MVLGVVEIDEVVVGGFFDDGFDVDGYVFGEKCVVDDEVEFGDELVEFYGVVGVFFGEDDVVFFVEFGFEEEEVVGVVGENFEVFGECFGFCIWKFEYVGCVVEGGVGVGVVVEVYVYVLEKFDDCVGWVVCVVVEGYVFEEMGEVVLVVGFVEGVGEDDEVEVGVFFGFVVGEDDVVEVVGEFVEVGGGVGFEVVVFVGEVGCFGWGGGGELECRGGEGNEDECGKSEGVEVMYERK